MEPQIPIPTPVPQSPSSKSKEFKKSKLIIVLAWIQVALFVGSFIFRSVHLSFEVLPKSIPFILPSLFVLITKNRIVYLVAKVLLIIEWLLVPIGIIILLLIFANF